MKFPKKIKRKKNDERVAWGGVTELKSLKFEGREGSNGNSNKWKRWEVALNEWMNDE